MNPPLFFCPKLSSGGCLCITFNVCIDGRVLHRNASTTASLCGFYHHPNQTCARPKSRHRHRILFSSSTINPPPASYRIQESPSALRIYDSLSACWPISATTLYSTFPACLPADFYAGDPRCCLIPRGKWLSSTPLVPNQLIVSTNHFIYLLPHTKHPCRTNAGLAQPPSVCLPQG